MQLPDHKSALLPKSFIAAMTGIMMIGSAIAFASAAQAAAATKPTKPSANAANAFCRQVTASQAAIAKAGGTPKTKLAAIGAEWTKIAVSAPADIKTDVLTVRAAYTAATQAGVDTAAKAPAVATAGQKISSYFAQNCGGGGIAGAGQGEGVPGGPGGDNSPERAAYRDCLAKNGLTLPVPGQRAGNGGPSIGNGAGKGSAPANKQVAGASAGVTGSDKANPNGSVNGAGRRGGGFGIDPADPAAAKAMKACESLRPAGGFGGGGPGGRGGFGNPAMQACLTKKGVKITPPAPAGGTSGAGGAANGNRPAFDAKTQAAFEACQKEIGSNG
jgi:hypothetical protein